MRKRPCTNMALYACREREREREIREKERERERERERYMHTYLTCHSMGESLNINSLPEGILICVCVCV